MNIKNAIKEKKENLVDFMYVFAASKTDPFFKYNSTNADNYIAGVMAEDHAEQDALAACGHQYLKFTLRHFENNAYLFTKPEFRDLPDELKADEFKIQMVFGGKPAHMLFYPAVPMHKGRESKIETLCHAAAEVYAYNKISGTNITLGKITKAYLGSYSDFKNYLRGLYPLELNMISYKGFINQEAKKLSNTFGTYEAFVEYVASELDAFEEDCLDYSKWAYKHNYKGVVKKTKNVISLYSSADEIPQEQLSNYKLLTTRPFCCYLKRHDVPTWIMEAAPEDIKSYFYNDETYSFRYEESSDLEWEM